MRGCSRVVLILSAAVFFFLISTPLLFAQQNGVKRAVTFAELTYGMQVNAVVADGTGGFWFGGSTCSTTLPTTSNAIQKSWSGEPCGGRTGLLGRMTGSGTVTYLSYVGGSGELSDVFALAVGPRGNLYVAGTTDSTDFPTTSGAYQRACSTCGSSNGSLTDGFVTELSSDGSQIVYSTYIGGSDSDSIQAIAVDSTGRLNVAGYTLSADFPMTPGALQPTCGGGVSAIQTGDGFYARFAADGSSLQYSTCLGGSAYDIANGVAVDSNGNAYVAGTTHSSDFPTVNAVQPQRSPIDGYAPYAFLVRFGASAPVYSTYVGGSGGDDATGVAVVGDKVYMAGSVVGDFPGAGDFAPDVASAYIAELSAASGAVARSVAVHGTPGSGAVGEALRVDANHVAYLTGYFIANDCDGCGPDAGRYPSTWDAYKRQLPLGDSDAMLSIVDFRPQDPTMLYSTVLGGEQGDVGLAVAPDGAGGVFIGGYSQSFDSINGQTPPPMEDEASSQSLVGHISVEQVVMPTPPADIALYAYDPTGISPTAIAGDWKIVQDSTAAGGWSVHEPDAGAAKVATAAAHPHNYFELEVVAQANVSYHLWLRMKADGNSYQNDSVWVQFSDSIDAGGNPVWRIHSTDGTPVSLEDCSGCGDQGWGWNDNGYGTPGTPVIFATSGWHTIRIQQREDGIAIDQIVLSSSKWANTAPGANKNDETAVPEAYVLPSGNVPPTVAITTPSDGKTYTPGSDIVVGASANDPDGGVSRVDFYANSRLIGSSWAAPYSTSWHNAPPGAYALTAVATDNQGAQTTSAPVSVTMTGGTSGGLPAGWTDGDVGNTGAAGSASYASGTYTVHGAGADVWGTSDAFNYVYTPLLNNGWIVARVATVSDQANWVKAGVMIRGSLGPSSWQAFMLVSHTKGLAFQRRTADGAVSVSTLGSPSTAPHWVKLSRDYKTISAYESTDGVNWTFVGADTFPADSVAFIGLAVSSHVSGTLATATFDSVKTSVPPPWTDGDIGDVPFKGSAEYSDGTFTVTGSGADVWGTSDAFHYVFQNLEGDGTIIAHVATIENVSPWVKAGVMIRSGFNPSSTHVFMLVSASKGVAFQRRDALAGTSVSTAGSAAIAPRWVKITRTGDTFSGYESADGVHWTLVGTDTIAMGTGVDIGLAVTSHNTSTSATCTFDHVSVQ
jgi:hypothetical protein